MRTEGGPLRMSLALLCLAATAVSAGDSYQLDRASVDHGGGGFAESSSYLMVIAIGQHDAGVESGGANYRYAGGVLARVPSDVVFRDGFEGDEGLAAAAAL
jgi:hypothetical protein